MFSAGRPAQKVGHGPPAVHTARADFALGGETLAIVLSDIAGLPEGVGNGAGIADRIPRLD